MSRWWTTIPHVPVLSIIVLCGGCIVPTSLEAAVIINEIAWMGDADSPNNEWVELHNTSDVSVSVDGWRLTDGNTINAIFSGSIPAGGYGVLERTDDDSAPGSALDFYTGALSNSGVTLSLYRADGGLEDTVAGGDNWENIGGNNTEKYTAQYTTNGWITAKATPGTANNTESIEPESETKTSSSAPSGFTKGTVVPERTLTLPDASLVLDIEAPTVAYVNQPITITAHGSGIGDTLLESLVFEWNFGDLNIAAGRTVTHMYQYPGEYVVHVTAEYARHSASERHTILVLPVAFSITRATDGAVQIHNDAKYEIDIGGYTLSGSKSLTFPQHTILLPRKTLTVSAHLLGDRAETLTLVDASGHVVVDTAETAREFIARQSFAVTEPPSVAGNTTHTPVTVRAPIDTATSSFQFASDRPGTFNLDETETPTLPRQQHTAAVVNAGVGDESQHLPYLGLVALLLVAIGSVLYTRST